MANVIDTLIVKMELDTGDYNKNAKAADQALNKFTNQTHTANKDTSVFVKNASEGFKSFRNQLLGIGAALMGVKGIKDFFASTITGQAELGRSAALLNTNAKELDAWGKVMGNVGGKAEDFLSVTQNMQKQMRDFKVGKGGFDLAAFFDASKIVYQDKDLRKLYGDLAEHLKNAPHDKRMNAAEALGLNPAMIALLSKGREEVQRLYDEQLKLSGVTDDSVKTSQEAEAAWNNLKNTFQGAAQKLFASDGVISALKKINEELKNLTEWVGSSEFTIKLTAATEAVKFALKPLTLIFEGWKNIIDWLGHGIEKLAGTEGKTNIFHQWAQKINKYIDERNGTQKPSEQAVSTENKPVASSGPVTSKADQSSQALKIQQAANKNDPRGIRNNNPGNIRAGGFADRHGAIGKDKDNFAIFPDMKTGAEAQEALLKSYANQGLDTIRKIVSKYAPKSENNVDAYIKMLSKETGVGADDILTASQRGKLQRGMWKHELGGEGMAKRVETSIGTINVYSQGNNAQQIAKDLPAAIKANPLVIANTKGGY